MTRIFTIAISSFILLLSVSTYGQIGIKAGLNCINVKNAGSISDANSINKTGFIVGAYFAPKPSAGLGYRSELIFSRQGYDFKSNSASGELKMDYIMLPQLMTINISRFFQLQAGGQIAFLVGAKADSISISSRTNNLSKAMDYFNKLNYGFAGGIEIRPFGGLLVGGRYNLFLAGLNEQMVGQSSTPLPSFIPSDGKKLKNALVQVYLGYEF